MRCVRSDILATSLVSGFLLSYEIARMGHADLPLYSQIDRLFAIWQASHDGKRNSWFRRQAEAEKPLLPFARPRNSAGRPYWDSNSSRSCENFGYSYPDILSLRGVTSDIGERFRQKYIWSLPRRDSRERGRIPDDLRPLNLSGLDIFRTDRRAAVQDEDSSLKPEPLWKTAESQVFSQVLESRISYLEQTTMDPATQAESANLWSWYVDDEIER